MGKQPERPEWLFVPSAATGGKLTTKGAIEIRAYIEHLETESAARMECIRHLRKERTDLSIQIMELEEQLSEARS